MNRFLKLFLSVALIFIITSCAFVQKFGGTDYGEAGSIGNLEAPPELVTPEWDESLQIPQTESDRVSAVQTLGKAIDASVAPDFIDVTVRREGDLRWLEAEVDPVALWPLLRSFWSDQGIIIDEDLPSTGLMETDWIEEIESEDSDATEGREVSALRTKYRLRVEREPNAVSNIFLTQRRTELQSITDQGGVWVNIDSDPEEEAEMIVNLLEHLGRTREDALFEVANTQGPRLYIEIRDIDDIPVLFVGDQYSRVWRRTGVALDRAGLEILDQNRNEGIYVFSTNDLEMPDEIDLQQSQYEVHLLPQKTQTLITAHFANNQEGVISEQDARIVLNQILSAYQVFRTTN
ncbi:MAG: outer membrane protein assembly factor BamC [Pseudomonadota bacterium]